MQTTVGQTAAIDRYLIERVSRNCVNLCESQGDQWITIRRDIDQQTATRFGFNPKSPEVQAVFAGVIHEIA